MLGNMRSNRSALLIVSVVIFLAAFVGLAYNHVDTWQPATSSDTSIIEDEKLAGSKASPAKDAAKPKKTQAATVSKDHGPFDPPNHPSRASTELTAYFLENIMRPSVKPDSPKFWNYGAFPMELPANPKWKKSLGEKLCIIDLDSRPLDEPGQIFSPDGMSWNHSDTIHGLSTGIMNHYVYSKIHGYKYYYINIDSYKDRRDSWKKPTIMGEILKKHDVCIYLDSDAIFSHLDLPFEWLLNYWNLHPGTNSLALAADPNHKNNWDKFGKTYLNTGFIVAQNNDKTYEIFKEWDDCPNDGGKHPECSEFRKNRPGKPTDQGGFGTYIRYDYPKDIKELPCTEANGFPESKSGCEGKFIKHLWTGKTDHIKVAVGQQLPGALLETFHKQFIEEMSDFIVDERVLMGKSKKD